VAVGLNGEHQTRANGLAVEQDRAGSAVAPFAADLGALGSDAFADDVEQNLIRLHIERPGLAVDVDGDG
jgi:hypothetical protein